MLRRKIPLAATGASMVLLNAPSAGAQPLPPTCEQPE